MAPSSAFLIVLAALPVAAASRRQANNMPGDVLCQSKLLAYKFAQKIQPERDASGLAVIGASAGVGGMVEGSVRVHINLYGRVCDRSASVVALVLLACPAALASCWPEPPFLRSSVLAPAGLLQP